MAEVAMIYLPPGEGGRKQGVDDFLAAGNTVADLLAHATSELREPPRDEDEDPAVDVPYRATPSGLVYDKPTQDGSTPVLLTNVVARIVGDVAEDDGAEVKRSFEVEATLGGRTKRFVVPAAGFASMGWVTEHLGASAIVYPGFGTKDHARAAVQLLSGEVAERQVFTHTGWREVGGEWVYLHAGGAIGSEGAVEDVEVRLGDALSRYHLPDLQEGEGLRGSVRASLRTWEIASDGLVIPQHAAAFRAAMGESDFSLHVVGPTGQGKSEVASLFARHYGRELDARHLLSWESTENALEGIAFGLKDSLVILDDFAPNGTGYDVQRWHKKSDRIFRGKGNLNARSRMGKDLSVRTPKPARALILSTGEDVPRGQSVKARIFLLEHGEGDVDWERLTECQRDAEAGLYAAAMSGFVSWLAPRYEELLRRMPEEARELREEASRAGQHKRTPGIVADLGLGLKYFLAYAQEVEATTAEEAAKLWERGWKAILGAAASQEGHQVASEPAKRFVELISSAVASGRAHIAATSGEKPQENAGALGWRKTGGEYADWRPQGDRIGWVTGDDLYLEPEASYRVAQREAQGGEALTVGARILRKRLKEKGYLVSIDEKRQTLTVRRTVEGVKDRGVLHLRLSSLFSDGDEPDEPDDEGEEPDKNGGSGPSPSSGAAVDPLKPDEKTDEASGSGVARRVSERAPDAGEPLGDAESEDERRVRRVSEGSEARLEDGDAADEPFGLENLDVYETVTTPYGLDELIAHLRGVDTIAVDLETIGLNPATLRVRIISVTTEKGTWLVDCFAVDPSRLMGGLYGKTLVFHNALFDLTILVVMGLDLGQVREVVDTLVMSRLIEGETTNAKEAA